MPKQRPKIDAQGVALVELAIERVRADPLCISGFCQDRPLHAARPLALDVLDRLAFPSGRPLPPSLRRWLAFDASWLCDLGWLATPADGFFTPRRLDEIVEDEFGMWGDCYTPLGQRLNECFLLPGGSDSRRIYVVSEPDSLGEYPVLAVDTDDLPYAGVMYPGFDVFIGDECGLCLSPGETYEALFDDPRYAARMNEHARHLFGGKQGIELYDEEWDESGT
jgi:hypothetical protein